MKVRFTFDVPEYSAAAVSAGDFITEAEEARQAIVRRALPEGRTSSVELIEVGSSIAILDTNDITVTRFVNVDGTDDSGGAAPYAVTGILASSTLAAVLRAKEATGITTNVTSSFTVTAADTVTGGVVDYSDSKLSFVWYDIVGV